MNSYHLISLLLPFRWGIALGQITFRFSLYLVYSLDSTLSFLLLKSFFLFTLSLFHRYSICWFYGNFVIFVNLSPSWQIPSSIWVKYKLRCSQKLWRGHTKTCRDKDPQEESLGDSCMGLEIPRKERLMEWNRECLPRIRCSCVLSMSQKIPKTHHQSDIISNRIKCPVCCFYRKSRPPISKHRWSSVWSLGKQSPGHL